MIMPNKQRYVPSKDVDEFAKFVYKKAHILQKYPKLTYQMAANCSVQSTMHEFGMHHLKDNEIWLKALYKSMDDSTHITTIGDQELSILDCLFSPDGRFFITSDIDKLIIWDAISNHIIRKLRVGYPHQIADDDLSMLNQINRFEDDIKPFKMGYAISPDSRYVVSRFWDNSVIIWDIKSGASVQTFRGHNQDVTTCAFSHNGHFIISGSEDKTLILWNVKTGNQVYTLRGHDDKIVICAFSPDDRYIISGSNDKTINIWDAVDGTIVYTYVNMLPLCFSPDGQYMAYMSFNSHPCSLRIWDVKNKKDIHTLEKSGIAEACAFSSDNRYLAVVNEMSIITWDIETGIARNILEGHTDKVKCCVFSPDNQYLVSGSHDRTIKIWGNCIFKSSLTGCRKKIISMSISSDGYMAVSASSFELSIWGFHENKYLLHQEIPRKVGIGYGCAFSSDGRYLLFDNIWIDTDPASSRNGRVTLFSIVDTTDYRIVCTITNAFITWIMSCTFSPDNKYIVFDSITNGSTTIIIRDLHKDMIIQQFDSTLVPNGTGVQFSLDGAHVVYFAGNGILQIRNIINGEVIKALYDLDSIRTHSISPDGKYIISGCSNGSIKMWDIETGKIIKELKGHSDAIRQCYFSNDGQFILSSSEDWTLRIWDVIDGNEIGILLYGDIGQFKLLGDKLVYSEGNNLYMYQIMNLPISRPILTAVRIYDVKSKNFEPDLTARCGHCHERFVIEDEWLDEDIDCPLCKGRLKLNPFKVDNRETEG